MAGGDTERVVKTVFDVEDNVTPAMDGMHHSAEQARDSLGRFIKKQREVHDETTALGHAMRGMSSLYDIMGSTVSGIGSILQSVASTGVQTFTNAIRDMGLAPDLSLKNIIAVGSEAENMQLQLAQTLKFMGQGGSSFGDAMTNAKVQMRQILVDSARLPGEAMDYAKALSVAGASAQRATGDYAKSYDLIRDMTAVSVSMGVRAELGALAINKMLNVSGGMMRVQSAFDQSLLNNMRQLPGYANITVQEFNRLDVHKRLELTTKSLALFKGMVEASAHTWESITGAVATTQKMLVEEATAPLFQGIKDGAEGFNALIIDSEGHWTTLGQRIVDVGKNISTGIVTGVKLAITGVTTLIAKFDEIASMPAFAGLGDVVSSIAGGAATALGAAPSGGGNDAYAQGFQAVISPFATMITSMTNSLQGMKSAVDPLRTLFNDFLYGLAGLSTAVAPILAGVFSGLVDIWNVYAQPIADFLGQLWISIMHLAEAASTTYQLIAAQVYPAVYSMFLASRDFLSSVTGLLQPVADLLIGALQILGPLIAYTIVPVFQVLLYPLQLLVQFLTILCNAIKDAIDWIEGLAGGKKANTAGAVGAAVEMSRIANDAAGQARMHQAAHTGYGPTGRVAVPSMTVPTLQDAPNARGGGGGTVQDFRYSRFEITQKFAEGFDPDRIAVAFSSDLGRLGEHKLQSGHEPMFALR